MRYFRLLTKWLFGWDWAIYRWGNDSTGYRHVRFTNMGKPYIRHIGSTYFLDEDHGEKIIGDTFEYPIKPANLRQVA